MGAAPREYIITIRGEFVQKKSGMFVHRYASLTEVLGFKMLCSLTWIKKPGCAKNYDHTAQAPRSGDMVGHGRKWGAEEV